MGEFDHDDGPALVQNDGPRPSLPLHLLTDSEAAVVLLALTGLSNKAIAQLRAASTRTVANQLAAAYRKLGGTSRGCLLARARLARRNQTRDAGGAALSARQRQVLALRAAGHPLKMIACELGYSISTVALDSAKGLRALGPARANDLATGTGE